MTESGSNPNALVLPAERAATSEAQTFPGFPGAYRADVPVLLSTIGLSLMEARALINDLGLPLVEHAHHDDEELAVPDANPPRGEGDQMFDSGAGLPEPPAGEVSDLPLDELTVPQLKGIAGSMGLSGFSKLSKDELVAVVDEARTAAAEAHAAAEAAKAEAAADDGGDQ